MKKILPSHLIERITTDKVHCIFISPHLDDAVLSAGDLLKYLASKTKVTVATVFTSANDEPASIYTRAFMRKCGFQNASELFAVRKKEDIAVLDSIGAAPIHMDFVDAAWRKFKNPGFIRKIGAKIIPDLGNIYPIHPLQINSDWINNADTQQITDVGNKIAELLKASPDAVVFCPSAYGSHIDHVITRLACEKTTDRLIYWKDLPYNAEYKDESNIMEYFEWKSDDAGKMKLIEGYGTQVASLFGNKEAKLESEKYYMSSLVFSSFSSTVPTVAIGIAAYNAENRIEGLVRSLINQEQLGFSITELLVHCDNCSDKTVQICEKIKAESSRLKITVIDNKNRRGFALSSLKMMEDTRDDIFVLLNDDIKIGGKKFIADIVEPLIADESVGLTSGRLLPIAGRTFVEKAVISTFAAYDNMRAKMKDKNSQFTYDGASMALSRKFINSIQIPDPISDLGNLDAYLYFSCRVNGFKYIYARKALLYHRYPSSFIDYKRQLIRNNAQPIIMYRQFKEFGITEYQKPKLLFLWCSIIEFIKNPLGCLFIFIMRFYIKIKARSVTASANLVWETVDTSKIEI